MIRVLVAEDSPTTRELLVEILGADPEVRVVGVARDGIEAVELTKQLRPSVVTMDLEMPGLDGFGATRRIMIEAPTPIVIVSRSVDQRDVEISMNSLRAGALTVLATPPGPAAPGFLGHARRFVETVKAMSEVKVVRRWARADADPVVTASIARPVRVTDGPCKLVAIAASTGGPAAVSQILAELTPSFPVPILVVQHIAVGFVEGFAAWLDSMSPLTVKIAVEGERLSPGTVYVAPDETHLGVGNGSSIQLSTAEPIDGFRPSATHMFDAVARAFGRGVIGVVLTGMGRDGVAGLRTIRSVGGRILAQDEESCVVFGMPGAAVSEGLPDVILPLDQLAKWLRQNVRCSGAESSSRSSGAEFSENDS